MLVSRDYHTSSLAGHGVWYITPIDILSGSDMFLWAIPFMRIPPLNGVEGLITMKAPGGNKKLERIYIGHGDAMKVDLQ